MAAEDGGARKDFFVQHVELHAELKEIIKESVISNTDVRIEITDEEVTVPGQSKPIIEPKFKPSGQPLEIGLVQFLLDNGEDINQSFITRNKFAPKILQLPFSQELKRKVVIRQVAGDPTLVRIYVKGAPEEVLKLCTQTLDQNAQPIQFLNDAKEGQLMQKQDGNPDEKNIWSMAADGLKVISYAFKEIETAELDRLFQSYSDESDEFRWELEQDLIYLCTFGMEDPCRVGLRGHVQKLRYGKEYGDVNDIPSSDSRNNQVNVRLLTGDHVETARRAGLESGIITASESMEGGCVMHADELREHLEGYTKTWDPVKSQF